ncbi:Sugar phosphate isomerase/epimerase [Pelosinus fermentans]|uniref:sugar phosphate isomerase/epimerase family protein n=1 Tax=Pelosinus fermentans TaxID=365349 RepID=UPI00026863CA|nr:TIM barrel protein [Pelosinus fermentans]OAM96187.1 Xylose isomerase domain-containing protein TIM barrel [Pelosinus fermentans DSM 17108]SDR37325.1 Sugar phosphate isomerase/epimerase [Pelosinus fermentans]
MLISLSNLSFIGFNYTALKQLPDSLGLEIFYEFGNHSHWDKVLKEIYPHQSPQNLSIHGPCIGVNLADENDSHYLAHYKDVFEFAAKWNAKFIVVHTNEEFTGDKTVVRQRVQHRLQELLLLSKNYEIQILIENVGLQPKDTLLFDWKEYLELLLMLPEAGALLDVGHAYINQWDLPDIIAQLGKRLIACHLHDNHGVSDDHLPIGQGTINWNVLFAAICSSAPKTTLVFEYANVDIQTALASIQVTENSYLVQAAEITQD